jgi:hypothetical protein
VQVRDVAIELSLDTADVREELEMLIHGNWMTGQVVRVAGGGQNDFVENGQLLERGARAIGRWPADNPYDDLVARLERLISTESDPKKRNKFQQFLDAVKGVGKEVGTELLVAYLKAHAGLPQ